MKGYRGTAVPIRAQLYAVVRHLQRGERPCSDAWIACGKASAESGIEPFVLSRARARILTILYFFPSFILYMCSSVVRSLFIRCSR